MNPNQFTGHSLKYFAELIKPYLFAPIVIIMGQRLLNQVYVDEEMYKRGSTMVKTLLKVPLRTRTGFYHLYIIYSILA